MAITASQIVALWGSATNDVGTMDDLRQQSMFKLEKALEIATVRETNKQIIKQADFEMASVLQAYQNAWTPNLNITLTPDEIRLFRVKVDIEFYPDDLYGGWTQFCIGKGLDRTQFPITDYIAQQAVPDKISSDIYNNLATAKRVAPTTGVAGLPSGAFNGIFEVLKTARTAGKITPIVSGAPATDPVTFTEQVEDIAAAIPEIQIGQNINIVTNRDLRIRFNEGNRLKYDANYRDINDRSSVMYYEGVNVKNQPFMAGQNTIFATPKENLVIFFNFAAHMTQLELQAVDRKVKGFTDFEIGIGFLDWKKVWVTDQLPA